MSPLATLLWARWRVGLHTLASLEHQSRLKVVVVSTSTVLLWIGGYAVARHGFGLLQDFGAEWLGVGRRTLAELVMAQLLSTFALILFVLLVLSNAVTAWGVLYRSHEMELLMLTPAGWRTLFLGRFWECVWLSSWGSAFLGSAALLAYGRAVAAPPVFYGALVGVFPAFVLLPAALGAMIALAAARWLPRLPRAVLVVLALAAVGLAYALFRDQLAVPDGDAGAAFERVLERSGASWLPSQWAAGSVLAAAEGAFRSSLVAAGKLWAGALLAVVVATEMAARWLYPGWADLRGGSGDGGSRDGGSAERGSRAGGRAGRRRAGWARFLRLVPEPYRSLTAKDLRSFWRDPGQWSQFLLFFGIMALYAANMRPAIPSYQRELWQGWISVLNATVVLLVLATLTTRFVFPLLSLEGRRLWLLGLSPLTMRQVMFHKVVLSVVATSVFTLPLAALSGWRLGLDDIELVFTLYTVAVSTVALSGLAVGLGAALPDFSQDNPARIVSGLGGTLSFVLSIVFVVLAASAMAWVLHWSWLSQRFGLDAGRGGAVLWAGLAVAVLGAVATGLPLRAGLRRLEAVEL